MKTLLESLQTNTTDRRYAIKKPPIMSVDSNLKTDVEFGLFSESKEYITKFEVFNRFYTTSDNFTNACDLAKKKILRYVYQEVHDYLDQMLAAIYKGDEQLLLRLVDELREQISG